MFKSIRRWAVFSEEATFSGILVRILGCSNQFDAGKFFQEGPDFLTFVPPKTQQEMAIRVWPDSKINVDGLGGLLMY